MDFTLSSSFDFRVINCCLSFLQGAQSPTLKLVGALIFLCFSTSLFAQNEASRSSDIAEVYVDQYFEPSKAMLLSKEGEDRAKALAHFTLGRLQENNDEMTKAIQSYLLVLELQPDQLELTRKTAMMLARSGKQPKARELLESSLKRNKEISFPYIMLSEFLSTYHSNDQDNKDRALELGKEAVQKFPKDPITYEHLSRMYLTGKKRSDAQKLLQSALEVESEDPNFWLRLGKQASRVWQLRLGVESNQKQLSLLNQFYGNAIEQAGEDDDVLVRSANFYQSTLQYEKAEEIYSSVITRQPNRLDLRRKLAEIYQATEDFDRYLETLVDIVRINPSDSGAHRRLAKAYRDQGEPKNAIKHQRTALKLGKGSADEYYKLGQEMEEYGIDLYLKGKVDESNEVRAETIKFIREAAYLFPEKPEFHWLVTFPLRQLNRYEEAIKHFEKYEEIAREENPDLLNERFYFYFGSAHEGASQIDKAAKKFNKSIEIMAGKKPQPRDTQSKKFTANVYNHLGYMWLENDMNLEAAGSLLQSAVGLDPTSGAIADSLGWYYFKVGEYENALEALLKSEQLMEAEPNFKESDPVILDHIAQTYEKLGDFEKALDYGERAVNGDKGDNIKDTKEFKERLKLYQEKNKTGESKPYATKTPEPNNNEGNPFEN